MKINKKNWSMNCQEIIRFGTYLILFTPLFISSMFFFPFVGPKSLYFMGLSEIIFFAWLFLITFDPRFRPRLNKILVALTLFLIVLIISSIRGVDPFYSFWSKYERMTGILMMLHLFCFFLVTSSTFEIDDWKRIFAVSIFVGAVIGIIASTSTNPNMRGGGTIGNDSFLGTYLIFNLFLALYLILRNEFRIYSLICFFMMFLSLFTSGARAAKLSFLGGALLLSFLWLIFNKKGKFKVLGVFLLAITVISAIYFAFSAIQPESFVRKKIIEKVVGETFGGRFIVWQRAWENFLERPFFGWGPENFEFAFTKNYDSCLGTPRCGADLWYDRAHNIIFDTLVVSGAFGMATYVGIFIAVFYVLWKNYFRKEFDFWTVGIFTVLLISYSVQNLTVFDMISSYMMFFLILGFVAKKEEVLESEIKLVNPFYLIPIVILFSLSFWEFCILPFRADAYVISAVKTEPFSEERLQLYKKALSMSPIGLYQVREFFTEESLKSLSRTENVPKEKIINEFDFLAQELEKSVKKSPLNFRSCLKLGQLYNFYPRLGASRIKEAERVLEKAIKLSPNNQQGYWSLAQTRLYQGKLNEALSLAEKAVELEPKLERSHIIVLEIAKMINDPVLIDRKMKEALEINPAWEKDLKQILESS